MPNKLMCTVKLVCSVQMYESVKLINMTPKYLLHQSDPMQTVQTVFTAYCEINITV